MGDAEADTLTSPRQVFDRENRNFSPAVEENSPSIDSEKGKSSHASVKNAQTELNNVQECDKSAIHADPSACDSTHYAGTKVNHTEELPNTQDEKLPSSVSGFETVPNNNFTNSYFPNPFWSPFTPHLPQPNVETMPNSDHSDAAFQQPAPPIMIPLPSAPGGFLPVPPHLYQEMFRQYFETIFQQMQSQSGNAAASNFARGMSPISPASPNGEVIYDDTEDARRNLKTMQLKENSNVFVPGGGFYPQPNMATKFHNPQSSSWESGNVSTNLTVPNSEAQFSPEHAPTDMSATERPSSLPSASADSQGSEEHRPSSANNNRVENNELQESINPEKKDQRTSQLISKQISEIDKEIIRRAQNQNIKKINRDEAEAFLSQHQQQFCGFSEAGIGWTQAQDPVDDKTLEQQQKTLNEIRKEQSPTAPQPRSLPTSPYMPRMPNAFVPPQSNGMNFAYNGMPQMCYYPPAAIPPLPPGMFNPAFAQASPTAVQQQYHVQQKDPNVDDLTNAQLFSQNQTFESNNESSKEVQNVEVQNSTTQNESNGGEPVWVLRESYVRKLKRDEDRQAAQEQAERAEEEAVHKAMTTQESAGPSGHDSDTDTETDKLLGLQRATGQNPPEASNGSNAAVANRRHSGDQTGRFQPKKKKKEVMIHEPAVLIEGVLFRANYLGSTQLLCEGRPTKATRMIQAQEAVSRIKAPEDETQPSTEVDLFISTEKIMVLNTDLQEIMMDYALRTISYIADIGDLVVLMARRVSQPSSSSSSNTEECAIRRSPKIICHIFESDEAQFIAQSIGQAFQVAYIDFLRQNGIEDPGYLRELDYQDVLNAQEIIGDELEQFANRELQKDVIVKKQKGEMMGLVIVESGWGSMLPTVVVANLMPAGAAARCSQLNIGDQIIAVNGISFVGLPITQCQQHIKNTKHLNAVKLTIVHTPPVVEVRIKRPDTKYQLGFSVQNGVICSLLRGGIAERGGVRVGHRIIEINGQSVVAVPHEKIVTMLATAIGEIQMKTMPTSMFRLLTGQEVPQYI